MRRKLAPLKWRATSSDGYPIDHLWKELKQNRAVKRQHPSSLKDLEQFTGRGNQPTKNIIQNHKKCLSVVRVNYSSIQIKLVGFIFQIK